MWEIHDPGLLRIFACVLLLCDCSSESVNTGSGAGGSAGSAGSTGAGGASGLCGDVCSAIDGAKCPGDSKVACLAVCAAASLDCPSARDDFAACVIQNQTQLTCDNDGKAVYQSCQAEWLVFAPCTVCIITPNDTPTEKCAKENCCAQMKDAYSRADALDYVACVSGCSGDDLCATNCGSTYPEAAQKFTALKTCQSQTCPAPTG